MWTMSILIRQDPQTNDLLHAMSWTYDSAEQTRSCQRTQGMAIEALIQLGLLGYYKDKHCNTGKRRKDQ